MNPLRTVLFLILILSAAAGPSPTIAGTDVPTFVPTLFAPTSYPTYIPTDYPMPATYDPTTYPTFAPTSYPTMYPTQDPTQDPTSYPTDYPMPATYDPTTYPTFDPTSYPTESPTQDPTRSPTAFPTQDPTRSPTANPTYNPTPDPTLSPTVSGDPHLTGLQGQQFDLIGRPGAQYNLITDQRAQVHISTNQPFFEHSADAKLRASGEHAGLFMTGVYVACLDANGLAHVVSFLGDFNSTVRHHERHCDGRNTEDSCLRGLQVLINGGEVAAPTMNATVGKGAELILQNNNCPFNTRDGSCKNKATNGGHGLATLVTPSVVIEVGAAFFNNHELMQKTVHHLDLALSEYRPSGKPRGLIGQTVELRYDSDGKAIMKGAGCIEGVEDDYIVSGLDAAKLNNSAFNEGSSFSASADGMAADGVKRT